MTKMDADAWNEMSSDYDSCVENNSDPVISGFIDQEIKLTVNLCKKVILPNKKYSIIDMGCGTGRVLFSLQKEFDENVSFYGFDASEPMIKFSKTKQNGQNMKNIFFHQFDVTDSKISDFLDTDSIKIPMCMYNTIGVIPPAKRQQFFDNMIRLAGKDGFVLISAFNGDNFSYAAPRIYNPMKKMVKKIDDDSFDEEKVAFRNSLGYYSQWFTKNQILDLLSSKSTPIPINVNLNGSEQTFGHVFTNRQL